jgi:subtilisin family serine protease
MSGRKLNYKTLNHRLAIYARICDDATMKAHNYKTVVLIIFLASLTVLFTAPPGRAQSPEAVEEVQMALATEPEARVVVALHPPVTAADADTQAEEIARSQDELLEEIIPQGFEPLHRFQTLPGLVGEVDEAGLQALLAHPEVAAVALDLPVEAALTESARFIGADLVWQDFGLRGAGVNVAVLDTGLDLGHVDLAGRVIGQYCFNRNGGCLPDHTPESSSAQDENGHGTHVAGIIGSQGQTSPAGVAPEAGLVAVRVLNNSGTGFSSDVLAGIDWVVAHQAELKVKLINLSLGGGSYSGVCDEADANTKLYAAAVTAAQQAGITLFAAAGNAGEADKMMAPACISGVVAVGNVYDSAQSRVSWPVCLDENVSPDQVACSSNSSSALDILAPGVMVNSTHLGGGQSSKSGTSISTPHVTAVAALLLQANPHLSPFELELALTQSGVPVTDLRTGRMTPRLDALAAVTQVTGSQDTMIAGTILLQGRNNHRGTQIFLSEAPCPTPRPLTPTLTTEANGHFEFSTPAGQRYRCLLAYQPGYLTIQVRSPRGDIGAISLLGGDVTGDNLVDIFDLALIGSRYGGNDPMGDINADGQVNIIDLVLTASNYGQKGPIEIAEEPTFE